MSDEPLEITVCENCGNGPDKQTQFCPVCGTEDPWTTEYEADFEDVDLPVVFSVYVSHDHYGLWKNFAEKVFGGRYKKSHVANLPTTLPRMKVFHLEVYWKLTEHYELKGPYLDESEARDA